MKNSNCIGRVLENRLIIDCGSTKLFYYLNDEINGRIAGNFNININDDVFGEIYRLLLGLKLEQLDIDVFIGIAGFSSYKKSMSDKIKQLDFVSSVNVMSDIELLTMSISDQENTLIGVLGTGSVFSYNKNDKFQLLGGYGNQLSEPGSARFFAKCLAEYILKSSELKINKDCVSHVFSDLMINDTRQFVKYIYEDESNLTSLSKMYFNDTRFEDIKNEYLDNLEVTLKNYIEAFGFEKIILLGSMSKIQAVRERLSYVYFMDETELIKGVAC